MSEPEDAYRERAKLDNRTWWLRASLSINIALGSGLLVHFLANCR